MSQKGPGENRDDLRPLAAKLYTKIVAAYGDTSWIAKAGTNQQQGYKFARAEDMFHQCREALAKHGLALRVIPASMDTHERTRQGKDPLYHTVMKWSIQIIDTETGYRESTPWYSECIESGDKAISKCATSALKYFLRTQLMIPTGDDPDATTPEPSSKAAKPSTAAKFPGSGEYLKSLTLNAAQVEHFKSACASRGVPWGQIALEAKDAGVATYEQLNAYVEDGVLPQDDEQGESATSETTKTGEGASNSLTTESDQPTLQEVKA